MNKLFEKLSNLFFYTHFYISLIYKKYKDIFFIIFNLVMLLYGSFVQSNILPAFPLVKTNDIPGFYSIMFQVQATVSTLSIAVIALISGIMTSSHYGISLTDYVMNRKPKILKYKVLIVWALGLIIVNTIFLSLGYYNLIIPILISSVLISIKLSLNVFSVYQKGGNLKNEIYDYIKDCKHQKPDKIKNIYFSLCSDCDSAISSNSFSNVREDLDLIIDLLHTSFINADKRINDASEYNSCKEYKEVYLLITKILEHYNIDYFELGTETIIQVCDLFSMGRIHCNIWDDISNKYFYIVSVIEPSKILNTDSINKLRHALYDNITANPDTWQVSGFLPSLYTAFTNNNCSSIPSLKRSNFWEKLLYNFDNNFNFHSDHKMKLLKREYLYFFLKLIECDDTDLLNILFNPVIYQCYTEEIFTIIACIYKQLKNHEEKAIITAYSKILNKIGYILYTQCTIDIIKKNCAAAVSNIGQMDNMELYDAKSFFAGLQTFEFILFYILTNLDTLSKDKITEIFDWFLKGPHDNRNAMKVLDYEHENNLYKKYIEFYGLLLGIPYDKERFNTHVSQVVSFVNEYFTRHEENKELG